MRAEKRSDGIYREKINGHMRIYVIRDGIGGTLDEWSVVTEIPIKTLQWRSKRAQDVEVLLRPKGTVGHERKIYYSSDTLCWDCANAVPNAERGCSWSRSLRPVDGWTAEWSDKNGMQSYIVRECPQFARG